MPQLLLLKTARQMFEDHGFTGDKLAEAVPYIREFHDKLIVLKIGGSIIEKSDIQQEFIDDVHFMSAIGIRLVIVHGGGKFLTEELAKRGVVSEFRNGLRVTTPETMEVAEEVFMRINHLLAARIQKRNISCLPYDRHNILIEARRENDELGLVGTPTGFDAARVLALTAEKIIPVVPSLGREEGTDNFSLLNINADTVAGFIAEKTVAEKLIMMTDVNGICNADGELISSLDETEVRHLIETQVIRGGMIPKVSTCLKAISAGVRKAHIINGTGRTFVNEVLTDKGVGTQILKSLP